MRAANFASVVCFGVMLCYALVLSSCGSAESPASPGAVQAAQLPPSPTATPLSLPPTATPGPTATATPDPRPPLSRTLNLLILGSDRRPNMPNWRTDVIMIVALDFENQRAGVISIPRDVFLEEIPNHNPNRINVVDYLGEQDEPNGGGPKLLAQLIEQYMGVPIHHFVRFDFQSFREVIDALGGIEVDVPCAYSDWIYNDNAAVRLDVQPGRYRMDGDTALAYVRSRRMRGDLDRAQRQQEVMWAVRKQILNENLLPRIPALYAALADAVQTDIDAVTAIRLVRFALTVDEANIHRTVLSPPDLLRSGWRLNMSVFVADWSAISEAVQKIFDRPVVAVQSADSKATSAERCG